MSDLAVIWDMGGVFNRYFTEVMVDIGRREGWPSIPMGPTGDLPDPDYQDMAAGRLEEAEYLSGLIERLGAHGIRFDPRTDIDWDLHKRPATWALIHQIHEEGRTQGILTNDASKWRGPNWWEEWEPRRLFSAVVDVAGLPHRKPHPSVYLAAAASIGRQPTTCVFVDDMPVNCRGAEAVGMIGHFFDLTDPDGSIDRLRALLQLPREETPWP